MTKSEAIEYFGTEHALAKACGVAPSTVGRWPDDLEEKHINMVTGAMVRQNEKRQAKANRLIEQAAQ